MRKYWYFQSNPDPLHREASVEVAGRTRGMVHVAIVFSQSLFGTDITPAQAREMAAALIERADEAESDDA